MKISSSFPFLVILSFIARSVTAKQGEGYDLKPDSQLRIGVKKRPKHCSKKSKKGDRLSVHYVGTLYKDGKEFDSSRERETPFDVKIGYGKVIKGWDQGLTNMCVGELRKLTIPSDLAYGEAGGGNVIHPGATLVFEIELLDILPPGEDDDDDYYGMMDGMEEYYDL